MFPFFRSAEFKLKKFIKASAKEIGFFDARFTGVHPIEAKKFLEIAAQEGRTADMQWLARSPEKRTSPASLLENAKTVICLALQYGESGIQNDSSEFDEKKARYCRGKDYHLVAMEKMNALWKLVLEKKPSARAKLCVDTSPILEKALAERAGLGFIGKHSILINEKIGSWFILCEIITDLKIPPDKQKRNLCGSCEKCLKACPTGAIVAPFKLDSRRCVSYWTTMAKSPIPNDMAAKIPDGAVGCDACQIVCPFNCSKIAQNT